MVEKPKTADTAAAPAISEAERMARIRELLVGPSIADQSARVDQSVGRLDQTLADQAQAIATLKGRLDDLQARQRAETERLDLRLLGVVEALLADEQGLRARLAGSDLLKHHTRQLTDKNAELDKSG